MTRVILEAALVATVTAYAVGDGYTPHHGVTASGARVEAGDTLAADWAYHPAGTRVWLAGVGWRTVTDRMGWAEHEERLTLRPGVTLAQIREGLLADAESETENA